MGEPDNASSPSAAPSPADLHAAEAQMTSALFLAAEALVAAEKAGSPCYAVPQDDFSAPILEDFGWLRDLVAQIQQTLAEDPRRAEMLRHLPPVLGNGEILQVLFGNLFPEQRHRRKETVIANGKKRLTQAQIEILRDFARGETPATIAVERNCTQANVNKILKSIEARLNTQSPQESVAVGISMGHLPLDVMGFVRTAARCSPRDYSPLDSNISTTSLAHLPDAAQWQELAAFGLMLMLTANTVSTPLHNAAISLTPSGVLYRLEPEANGTFRARQIVGAGRLCSLSGIVIAPPAARHQGFIPGAIYVIHLRDKRSVVNYQEIAVFSSDGSEQSVFAGGRTILTGLHSGMGMTFDASGRLLVTSGNALQRFTAGGERVQPLIQRCCTGVALAAKERLYLAHYSSRGGSIGLYTPNGKLRQEFAQLPMDLFFPSLLALPGGEIAALRCSLSRDKPEEPVMQIYDAEGNCRRQWRVEGASPGAFAFHARDKLFYIPCRESRDIAVYAPDGKLQKRIPLPADVTPHAVTFGSDGILWLIGTV